MPRDITDTRRVKEIIELWTNEPESSRNITSLKVIPARKAVWSEWHPHLHESLVEALHTRGMKKPYIHQAKCVELLLSGESVVVVTPTASGKTLCYNIPVLNEIVSGGSGTALYLFPTKALSQDQKSELDEWSSALGADIGTCTFDGDTPPGDRPAIRKAANILITNPDMLHLGILPHHTKWASFFSRLRYVVIDEMHIYRGIFGSHFANLIRRLKRISRFYGSNPVFICCSATIANPLELACSLVDEEMTLVDENGAPSSEKYMIFYNPPVVNDEIGLRANYIRVARTVAAYFIQRDVQSIVFATSRMNVEILLKYLREEFAGLTDSDNAIAGYRGGYLPAARRRIEKGLRDGEVRGVVATNALELGIDIGRLDACIIAGYPGSIASALQQAGRAGRRCGSSAAVLVARSNPLDQFIVNFPEYFFGRSPEHGRVNPDNLHILISHIRCAAFELPLNPDENFGGEDLGEILTFLEEKDLLHLSGGSYHYTDEDYPAQSVSLRTATPESFVVIDSSGGNKVIADVDYEAAHRTLYENAVYMAEGVRYLVERLDWEGRKAYVRREDVDYFTIALGWSEVRPASAFDVAMYGPCAIEHGEVEITSRTTGFKKVRFYTGENLGEGEISVPERTMQTTSYWFTLPHDLTESLDYSRAEIIDGVLGVARVLHNIAAVTLMSDPADIGWSVGDRSSEWFVSRSSGGVAAYRSRFESSEEAKKIDFTEIEAFEPTVYLYDNYPGGIGFSEVLYNEHETLLRRARGLVEKCPCPDGCPSCVGPAAEVGIMGKELTVALLTSLLELGGG